MDKSAMSRLFRILIWTFLLASMYGQVLFDDMGDQQRSADLALYFMRTEFQQFSQDIERLVMKKIDRVANIIEVKINKMETKNNECFTTIHKEQRLLSQKSEYLVTNLSTNIEKINDQMSTIHTEHRLFRPKMISVATKVDTLLYNCKKNNLEARENVLNDMRNGSDCANILENYPDTRLRDGVYNIMVSNKTKAVYCDMTTDNGGWTVIQRRVNGSVDFNRNWADYKNGFGFAEHEHWIGNDMLHVLTSLKPQELRVDMERFNGEKAYAVYSNFSVGDEASKYQLQVNGYSGTAGDGLNYNTNMKFSTRDQDNDECDCDCANERRSAWWFDYCAYANPNGLYTDSEKTGSTYYIMWSKWKNSYMSLKTMQLMIRPRA
ncbi:fibrinogen-like protein 1 [Magallana gigas]|uniref:fibrinogen-like protein 1 n=1 Tax=Magallana gigas TaxID=29159 RepID=UPI003341698E